MAEYLSGQRAGIEANIRRVKAIAAEMRAVMSVEASEEDKAERAVTIADLDQLIQQYEEELAEDRI